MREPMRRKFVALGNNSSDQRGVTLRDPTKGKKCSVHSCIRKQLQDSVHIPFDAALSMVPIISRNKAEESLDLKIVFHIYSERIFAAIACDAYRPPDPVANIRFAQW